VLSFGVFVVREIGLLITVRNSQLVRAGVGNLCYIVVLNVIVSCCRVIVF